MAWHYPGARVFMPCQILATQSLKTARCIVFSMQMDNLVFAYLLRELSPLLEGAYVNKVSEISSGTLKFKLHTRQGSKDLIITPQSLFISNYLVAARHGKTNFAVALKKELYNKRIVGIEQHELDRVICLKMLEHTIVLEFIGEGNKILLGKDGKALSCERNEKWADRETRKGVPYRFPRQQGINPAGLTVHVLHGIFENSGKDTLRAMVSGINVSPQIAEEALFRLGMEKSAPAVSLNDTQAKKILEQLDHFYSLKEKPFPCAYRDFIFPFRLLHLKEEPRQALSFISLLDEEFSKGVHLPKAQFQKGGQKKKDRAASHEFMQKQQEQAREKFDSQMQENLRRGELIYQHYMQIEELQKAVLAAIKKGLTEKQIMEKISGAAVSGSIAAKLLKKVDVRARKMELELE